MAQSAARSGEAPVLTPSETTVVQSAAAIRPSSTSATGGRLRGRAPISGSPTASDDTRSAMSDAVPSSAFGGTAREEGVIDGVFTTSFSGITDSRSISRDAVDLAVLKPGAADPATRSLVHAVVRGRGKLEMVSITLLC